MAKNLVTSILMTVVTTLLLGLAYPLAVTGLAQVLFPDKANGQLVERDGKVVGSRIIGQPFSGTGYFRSRPSAAGAGFRPGSTPSSGRTLVQQPCRAAGCGPVRRSAMNRASFTGRRNPLPIAAFAGHA